jgi:chromosome segregation protein
MKNRYRATAPAKPPGLVIGRSKMDKGAHYIKADLQVHTPRDPNWKLSCATNEKREEFAAEFIKACRDAGLGAVAITDHHDFGFVPWIRKAAKEERDEGGESLAPEERLVVFPGLELSLAVPCQALLIFSADFPDDRLPAVLEKLGIDPAAKEDSKAKNPTQLGFHTFKELYKRLDETEWLRGQYTVFPNVTDGGHQTLMRSQFYAKYREMPCVGGYLDGPVAKIGGGNRRAFAGKDSSRGYKRLAVIQTSDAREFQKIGSNASWIKWAQPTAEALRQACLAEESRITHTEPTIPAVHITRIKVSASAFMGSVDLEFNPQYNAFIGGRGTGKSTCLEYLRWALCDEERPLADDDDGPDAGRRRRLIGQTLETVDGNVEVHFMVNEIPHVIRRHAKSGELLMKVGREEMQPATEDEVQSLLPIEAYSQRQLSNVGIRLEELQRFVTGPIRSDLERLELKDADLARDIRENFVQVQRQRSLEVEVHRDELTATSLGQQIGQIRETLSGLSDEDRETMATKGGFDEVDGLVENWLGRASQARQELADAAESLERLMAGFPAMERDDLPEATVANELRKLLTDSIDSARRDVLAAEAQIASALADGSEAAALKEAWEKSYADFDTRYDEATQRSSTHASKLKELRDLEGRHTEMERSLRNRREELTAFQDPASRHAMLRTEWIAIQGERTALLATRCHLLTELSDYLIRADVRKGAGTSRLEEGFRTMVKGSNLRAKKTEDFLATISSSEDPLAAWHEALDELEVLAVAEGDPSAKPEPPTSALKAFTDTDLKRVVGRVKPEMLLELSLAGLDDHPVFEYRTREGEYIDFSDASAGQQATALLRVLLNQPGAPLVIDQPEDDLDSQVLLEIVDLIWKAKEHRQLIFASHNANLVVNGDAELVVCCDYRDAGDHSAGEIKLEGAIDIPGVRDEITVVMEGGEKAFRLRKEKYGF